MSSAACYYVSRGFAQDPPIPSLPDLQDAPISVLTCDPVFVWAQACPPSSAGSDLLERRAGRKTERRPSKAGTPGQADPGGRPTAGALPVGVCVGGWLFVGSL